MNQLELSNVEVRTKVIRRSLAPAPPQTSPSPANQADRTALQTSIAKSGSVCVKSSGEYSYRKLVPCCRANQSVERSCQRGTSTLKDRSTHSLSVNFGELPDQLGVLDCESDRLLLGIAEDDGSEERRRSVVEMDDDVLGTPDSVEGTLDEVGSSGREDLAGGSVVRSVSFVFERRAQSRHNKREGEPQHEDKTAWQSENHLRGE